MRSNKVYEILSKIVFETDYLGETLQYVKNLDNLNLSVCPECKLDEFFHTETCLLGKKMFKWKKQVTEKHKRFYR